MKIVVESVTNDNYWVIGNINDTMGEWSRVKKCCYCISLTTGIKVIGTLLFTLTLGLFLVYLAKINDVRDFILDDMYKIAPCSLPPLDTLVDTAFEYSILANILLMFSLRRWTRWLLIPWLIVYLLDILLLTALTGLLCLSPPPLLSSSHVNYSLLRLFGLVPAVFAVFLLYCWIIVRSQFIKLGQSSTDPGDCCCPLRLKTGVQIIGGILALLSGAFLVLFFAMLDDIVSRHYFKLFQSEISRATLTLMAGCIVLSILVNILLILGGTGSRWRRSVALPWLLFYGSGIIICLYTHLYFTSQCWIHDKIIGACCLGLASFFLILWTPVWMVAAQVTEKHKTMVSAPSDVAFQRL